MERRWLGLIRIPARNWLLLGFLTYLLFVFPPFLLIPSAFMTFPAHAISPGTNGELKAEARLFHKVEILDGGSILVNDSLTLRNLGIEAIDSFLLGFPEEYREGLDHIFAYDGLGERLSIENESLSLPGIFAFRVKLKKALAPNEETIVKILLTFSRLISFSTSLQRYEAHVFLSPILAFNVSSFFSELVYPQSLEPVVYPENLTKVLEVGKKALVLNASSSLQSFTSYKADISFQGSLQILSIRSLKRTVEVSPEGMIRVFDAYEIQNPIARKVSSINIILGKGAKGIEVEDSIGPLSHSESPLNETSGCMEGVEVKINLRDEIKEAERVSFTVSYELPRLLYASSEDGIWNQVLSLRLPFGFKAKVERFFVQILLPYNAQLLRASSNLEERGSQYLSEKGMQTKGAISWEAEAVSFLEEPAFLISYAQSILWSTFQPMVFALLLSILAYGVLQYRPKAPAPRAPSVSPEAVKGFIEACGRYMELELELEKLMEEAERGKIGRSQLRMMMGRLNERKRELERAISEAGGILRRLGGRYENIVVEIEEARAQIETIRMGIESLRNQYRVGRISKIVYERLLRDYSRRLEGERAKVRRNLEALKG